MSTSSGVSVTPALLLSSSSRARATTTLAAGMNRTPEHNVAARAV